MSSIFVTGGSGFIGRHVLTALANGGHRLYVLVRSEEKLRETLKEMGWRDFSSLVPIRGDLTQPSLGIGSADLRLLTDVEAMIHAGGPMDILLSADEARQVFLNSAREMADLARRSPRLRHFIHVVGFKSPYSEQNDGVGPQADHGHKAPPYEKMKFESDLFLRRTMKQSGIPLSVVNPSVVIGDSRSGITEQTGGFGLLVNAVRRNMMGLVPGGDDYWLPLVHVDHVAAFIAALAEEDRPVNGTYFLLDNKKESPGMKELIGTIAREVRVGAPKRSAPYGLVKGLLNLGAGKLLGLPKESMDFIVRTEFPTASKLAVEAKHGLNLSVSSPTLPLVVADLDYRLNHGTLRLPPPFRQHARAGLATIESEGRGTPIVILHGAFSASYNLLPMALRLAESGYPVCLADLPGFGRSPYHHRGVGMDGFEQAILALIRSFDSPVRIVGHSFGGYLAARMLEAVPERIAGAVLLQPVLEPVSQTYRHPFATKTSARTLSENSIRKRLIRSKSFREAGEIPEAYPSFILEEMKSPRTRTTTAEVMSLLSRPDVFRLDPGSWSPDQVFIAWGQADVRPDVPEAYSHLDVTRLPYAHQFPISHPGIAADWILERL